MGAPMAGFSGGALAAAVTDAGGLGFIAAGHLDQIANLRKEIDMYHELVQKPAQLCLGFIGYSSMANGSTDRVMQVIQDYKPFAVQFFAPAVVGDNAKQAQSLGSLVLAQVGSLEDAKCALEAGVDCIIAQGREAGGHGLRPELASPVIMLAAKIFDMVRESESKPSVLAAGGFADGKGLVQALNVGCDGVVFGTRLYASKESLGQASFKQRLVEATVADVVRTRTFDAILNTGSKNPWPSPFDSVGCVRNQTTDQWDQQSMEALESALETDNTILQTVQRANREGDAHWGLVHAGESVGAIHSIESANKILISAEEEALRILKKQLSPLVYIDNE